METNTSTNGSAKMNILPSLPTDRYKFINTNYLMEISSGNPDFIHVFLNTFKDEAKRSLASLQNQLRTNDFHFMEKTAHAMKPSGVYVGSNTLTLLVGLLEKAARNLDKIQVSKLVPEIQTITENILIEIDEYLK